MDKGLFIATLSQLAYLFILIAIGYLLMKLRLIPENTNTVLSKLENTLFLPALMLTTFINGFTPDKLAGAWKILLGSVSLELIIIPLSVLIAKLCYKTDELRKIATYGLSFANFGFMGNAVMLAIYPKIFVEYQLFTLPLWIFIMTWGVPTLLLTDTVNKLAGIKARIKPLVNPMLICMLIGMIIGVSGVMDIIPTQITAPIMNVADMCGSIMSPVAMLLTGMTLAKSELLLLLKKWRVYIVSVIRLFVIPVIFLLFFSIIPKNSFISESFIVCAISALAMPLGLNTIVIPTAYGKDTSEASSMALISHVLSVVTIPTIFTLVKALI